MSADDSRAPAAEKLGDWWLPYNDKKSRRHFKTGGIQMDHLEKALEYVRDRSLAVDGGAHVGSWTRRMAQCFGRVIAYELAPDTFECLQKNTAGLTNVKIIHAAIGDKPGRVGIKEPESFHTLGRCVAEGDEVRMLRLDDEGLDSLGFLKLDLEGYEYFGLKGAKKSIKKFKPVILIEDKGHGVKFGAPTGACQKFLESLGYVHVLRMKPDHLYLYNPGGRLAAFFRKALRVISDKFF